MFATVQTFCSEFFSVLEFQIWAVRFSKKIVRSHQTLNTLCSWSPEKSSRSYCNMTWRKNNLHSVCWGTLREESPRPIRKNNGGRLAVKTAALSWTLLRSPGVWGAPTGCLRCQRPVNFRTGMLGRDSPLPLRMSLVSENRIVAGKHAFFSESTRFLPLKIPMLIPKSPFPPEKLFLEPENLKLRKYLKICKILQRVKIEIMRS